MRNSHRLGGWWAAGLGNTQTNDYSSLSPHLHTEGESENTRNFVTSREIFILRNLKKVEIYKIVKPIAEKL